jgi:general secretion pathway protein E
MSGLKQVCPKCRRELKLIGTDYRKPGARYVCNSCHEIFASPAIKCRCLKTGEVYALEELRHIYLYSYCLNEAHRKRLEFEFEPKKQLIDYLKRLDYNVQESVKVQGRSGATHTIDLLANIEDPITRHSVAIGILVASNDETEVNIDALFSFDSKIYDTGIDSKMVIAVPRLTSEAAKFAERQSIRVYSLDELRDLSSRQTGLVEVADVQETLVLKPAIEPDLVKLGPRGWLRWLLEKKGYRVEEKYKLKGRSGAEHILDFYAQKDDGIMCHTIAACVISNEDNQGNDASTVTSFDSATYDVGIRDKVIISVPKLGKEARQFADYQRIKILEAKDLADFSRQYLENTAQASITR